jgi:hypothetical protein
MVDLATTQAFTMETVTNSIVNNNVYMFGNQEVGGIGAIKRGDGVYFDLYINGAYLPNPSFAAALENGQHSFAGAWSGASGVYAGYVDGVKNTVAAAGVLTNPVSNTVFSIGSNPGGTAVGIGGNAIQNGQVHAARLYNRALGDREVRFNQAIDKARFGAGASMAEWAGAAGFEIDGNICANLTVVNDSTITCTTPAGSAGAKATEFTMAGDSFGLADYTYEEVFVSVAVDDDSLNLSGLPNQLMTGNLTVNTITNNPTGYNLTIKSADTDLICETDSSSFIPAVSGTATDLNNTWGYAVGATTPNTWTGITTSPVLIKNFITATDLTLGDDTGIWFGAQVDISKPACKYSGTVTFTAMTNII